MEDNRHRILQSTFDGSIDNRKASYTVGTLYHTWIHICKIKQKAQTTR